MQDGFFKGSPYALAQTRDGYLWVGTRSELLRFDGVRFVPWRARHGEQLPNSQISSLLGARDGSLWIGTRGGLSRWKAETLTNYLGVGYGVLSIVEDDSGDIWFSTYNETGTEPLCRVVGAATRCVSAADGMPPVRKPTALTADARGNLWIGGDTTLVRWSPSSHTAYRPEGLAKNFGTGFMGIAPGLNGSIWVGIALAGPGLGLQRIIDGKWASVNIGDFDGSTLAVVAMLADREGTLWIGTSDRGLFRLRDNHVDHYDRTNGLSSNSVTRILEDREGNLWVATTQGIDRFSDTPVVSLSDAEGLCSSEASAALAAGDGGVWIGGTGGVTHLTGGHASCLRSGEGLPGVQVTSLLEDHAGRLWVGIDNELWIYERGRFRRVARPGGRPMGFVTSMAMDAAGDIWVVANRPPRTVSRIHDLAVDEELTEGVMPRRVAADPTGGLWLGLVNGDLAHYRDGRLQTFPFVHTDSAILEQLLPGPDGSILAATSYGVIGWQNGRPITLTEANGLPCHIVNGIVFDDSGNLWLSMDCALARVSASELQKWKTDPRVRLSIQTLDELDGVITGSGSFNTAARSWDGQLWFANGLIAQRLDPRRLGRNEMPPPVHVEQLIADRTRYDPTSGLRLPAHTRDLEIDYVGLSFVAPQKVLFRYRLEGRDDAWQEPGTRRQAFYSDLRPGRYRFRVIASNNDGLWNEEGAALDFVVLPAWYQTYSFFVLCTVIGAMSLWALYHLRVRQVARTLNARFDERLAERTRVAREIHDTLLQTVQGSKLAVDDALDHFDDGAETRRTMEQVSLWLGQATREGRATVNSLRASTTEQNDLADAFRRAMEDCRRQGSLETSLEVTGDPREMHPIVRDEVYRIGYEAIRNACLHSGGSRLGVKLEYAQDLTLRVADNGVGIDPAVADGGKDGHFGLRGMRERAARIGASLQVTSSADQGTEIVVVVPSRTIFRTQTSSLFDKFRARLG
jgi:signal transduction histidine kinase/ligand-binding sensor domain-containing protein